MYLDLNFDKDEYEQKLSEHESVLDLKDRDRRCFDRKTKPDSSKYLLQETKSSFKMKSQFQISKKQFFAKITKDTPNPSTTKSRTYSNPSTDKVTQNSTSKNLPNSNPNFAYGSIRASPSTSSLGSESIVGGGKFDFSKKNNMANMMANTELVVESYGFPNKPEYEELVCDENPLIESASKSPGAKGIFTKLFAFHIIIYLV